MAVSDVSVCNRALQKLGAERITSLAEDTRNARSCNACYEVLRDAELRAHPWAFSIRRVTLAPLAAAPAFGFAKAFQLPADALRVLPPDNANDQADWTVEGRTILTDDGTSINLRYVKQVTDPTEFDALFVEALASRIAYELAEELTQSNTKKEAAAADRKAALAEARRTNAIEQPSREAPDDPWITARL